MNLISLWRHKETKGKFHHGDAEETQKLFSLMNEYQR